MTSGANRLRVKRKLQQETTTRNSRKLSGGFEKEAQAKASILQSSTQQTLRKRNVKTIQNQPQTGDEDREEQAVLQIQQRGRRLSCKSSKVIEVQRHVQQNFHLKQHQMRSVHDNYTSSEAVSSPGCFYRLAPQIVSQQPNNIRFDSFEDYNCSYRMSSEVNSFLKTDKQRFGQTTGVLSIFHNLEAYQIHSGLDEMQQQSASQSSKEPNDDQDISAFFGAAPLRGYFDHKNNKENCQGLPSFRANAQRQPLLNYAENYDQTINDDDDFSVFRMTSSCEEEMFARVPLQTITNNACLPWKRRQTDIINRTNADCHEVTAYNDLSGIDLFNEGFDKNTRPFKKHRGQIVRFFDNGVEVNPGKVNSECWGNQSSNREEPCSGFIIEATRDSDNEHALVVNPKMLHQGEGETISSVYDGAPFQNRKALTEVFMTSNDANMTNAWKDNSSSESGTSERLGNISYNSEQRVASRKCTEVSEETKWTLFGKIVNDVDLLT